MLQNEEGFYEVDEQSMLLQPESAMGWQWQNQNGWANFDMNVEDVLTEAYQSWLGGTGQSSTMISVASTNYVVDFYTMKQKNARSNRSRAIRFAPRPK